MNWTMLLAAVLVAAMAPASLRAQSRTVDTQAGPVRVDAVAGELEHPWGIAFLPDGRMLVTERPGRMRIVTPDGRVSAPLAGVPAVFAQGQGGLLGLALDPNFDSNRLVYFCYSEPGEGGASTATARGRLNDAGTALENVQVIFRQMPKVSGPNHFGGRVVFAPDGKMFVTLGERFKFEPAQDLSSDLGKLVRLEPDGSIPKDNPFVGKQGVRPEIWSYGHRNVQGAAFHPQTGVLWISEFGPRGGDELNIPEAGKNYGWPLVSWGEHYNGTPIPKPPTRPDLAQPIYHWTPVISPSGMSFYTGEMFPTWRGNLLIAGLTARGIVRLTLDKERVTSEERIGLGARIRDVQQGRDGAVYALTDQTNGAILKLTPAKGQ